MEKTWFLYLSAVAVVVSLAQYCFIPCLALNNNVPNYTTDQSALLAFKSHIIFNNPHHILANNWSLATSICNWIGVSCGKHHHRVTTLNLPDMGIGGTIPPHIGNLSFLSYFNITNNTFHGHLPSELARLHRLNVVDFRINNFDGGVPTWFGNLPKLQYLILRNNSFNGPVPSSIGNISELEFLDLSYNLLEGSVPEEIGNLGKLKWLKMGSNYLSGSIPATIFNMSSLESIDFTTASFSGSLPEDICVFLPKLKSLSLSENEFEGQIPSNLGECTQLRSMSLSYNKFTGFIPKAIGNLTLLQTLYIGDNYYKGEIPQELGSLPRLETLAIERSNLTVLLPSVIFNISSLKVLFLQNNNLFGSLPRDMCFHQHSLQIIHLGNNKLTGNIPREIVNCTLLSYFYLYENNLTGLIPEEIGELQNMRRLSLSVNNFMGPIPTSIFNISSLEILSLAANQLLGNLPSNTGLWLPNLNTLYLGANKLGGVIPDSISNASKLITLDLSENAFMGLIPKALGNLQLLEFLNLAKNNLRSSPKLSFITSFANCKQLKELGISFNPLNGILPTSIGNLSASLENIYADSCGIKGNIPSEIGNLSNLAFLRLQQNDLIGSIPSTVKVLGKLQILYLSNNKLQGSIQDDLCQFKNMGDLRLNHNELSGLIPKCLGNVTSLRYLYLDSNKLSSSIPTSLRNLKDILEINMSTNSLNGNLPLELGNLKVAILIDLSMNQFIGEIPSTITGLQNLVNLSLAYNRLQGPIPDSFGNMVSLEFLDLSYNNLSGVIPKSLETLSHLSYLNVSFNKLRGQIPTGGPFANFTIQSFMSNEALCGAPKFQVPPCHIGSPNHLRKKIVALVLYILLPIAFILLATTFAFLLTRSQKRNKTPANFDLLPTITPPRITYQQLFQATNGFGESNLLGMGSFGSVYKAILEDATILAIKVFNLEVEAAFKSFDIECEITRSIRHRNLVKVISNCSNLDFKALVFEYMPNGSLEKWLYSYNYFLDMLQRLNIMIDVACALEYLHHGYSTPLVHCDLKPSNILLDKDMVAHVSDFGIAKLLDLGESVIHTKTIATFGYIAPEFGLEGLVSTNCDVYSYGILLMETFTRVKPTDEMFIEDMTMKCWIMESLPNSISHVIDANLLKPEKEQLTAIVVQCVSSIMELALSCCVQSPEERINMKDVLTTLKKVRLLYLANCERT
ncbi:unnamed protein product [Camellia sinensis]